jgi:glycosyltransferase involved in cell wall biosynthesis
MHVWLIQQGEPLPTDAGVPRLLRTGLLADALVRRGHEVTWWAATFNHATKTQRASSDQTLRVAPAFQLHLLHSPGYARNISFARIRDHRLLGRSFAQRIQSERLPDVIHCAFPTIELAFEAARFAKDCNVPIVMDARDMWPDIFVDALPDWLRPVGRMLLGQDFRMTRYAFQNATAISAHAPGFVDWGLRYAGRSRTPLDVDFPFSYPEKPPSQGALAAADGFWRDRGVMHDPRDFVVCFFGTFAARKEVDLDIVPAAARLLAQRAPRVKFILCGDGPAAARLARETAGLQNVVLPGWVDFPRIWSLMRHSQVGLLPYLPSRDFIMSVPNKAVEYLSAGLPILTSLQGGYLNRLIDETGCGALYAGRDPQSLAAQLEAMSLEEDMLASKRLAARRLFDEQLRADVVTTRMIHHLEQVAAVGRPNPTSR